MVPHSITYTPWLAQGREVLVDIDEWTIRLVPLALSRFAWLPILAAERWTCWH